MLRWLESYLRSVRRVSKPLEQKSTRRDLTMRDMWEDISTQFNRLFLSAKYLRNMNKREAPEQEKESCKNSDKSEGIPFVVST